MRHPKSEIDLLPHFTVQLWCALEDRLTRRIEVEYRTDFRLHNVLKNAVMMPHQLAHDVVARIYRFQYKEAMWLIGWADAMIAANPKPVEEARKQLASIFGKPRPALVTHLPVPVEPRPGLVTAFRGEDYAEVS